MLLVHAGRPRAGSRVARARSTFSRVSGAGPVSGSYLYFTPQPYGFDDFTATSFPLIAASSDALT